MLQRDTPADPSGEDLVERLATFLSGRGVLDELTLRRAPRAQKQSGERFDLVLTRLGLITEADLARLLSEFLGMPLLQASELPEVPLLENRLQLQFLEGNHIVPVADRGDSLLVAIADPFNTGAPAALSYLLGRPVARGVMQVISSEHLSASMVAVRFGLRMQVRDSPSRQTRTMSVALRTWRARHR